MAACRYDTARFSRQSERENENPYIIDKIMIISLERSDQANDGATYSLSLEDNGEVTIAESSQTGEVPTELRSWGLSR